jgi:hypothetical protein
MPSEQDCAHIEKALSDLGIAAEPLQFSSEEFRDFRNQFPFPLDYYRGRARLNWEEKLLEHFIAFRLGGLAHFDLGRDVYMDIAASNSHWVKMLRKKGYIAYAIDLNVGLHYRHLSYYLRMDAKHTSFSDGCVKTIWLQCA